MKTWIGIDVAKAQLVCAKGKEVREFTNDDKGIASLEAWAPGAGWCMEATGRFHELAAKFAFERNKPCLVVNPGRAKKYLGFVEPRAKTDQVDAVALARLAEKEGDDLRPFKPVPATVQEARDHLAARRALVESRVALAQVRQSVGDVSGHLTESIASLKSAEEALLKLAQKTLKGYPAYQLLLGIPGIGPVSAAYLVCTLERGEFLTSDSLVAFAGLDPRPMDSGKKRGKRRLSHQGDAALRTALFMAARTASRMDLWKPYYQKQRDKGLSTTASTVILARKLSRVAWSIYKSQTPFQAKGLDTPT